MSKRPSYERIDLDQTDEVPIAPPVVHGRSLKEVSHHFMVYISEEAGKALASYALAQSSLRNKVTMHDLAIEALEDWFKAHGLRETVRAKPRSRGRPRNVQ